MMQQGFRKWLGLGLIAASFAFYGGLLLVPFAPFSTSGKILLSSLLVICGEGSFWIGVLILGKQVVSRYRSFNLRSCLGRIRGLKPS